MFFAHPEAKSARPFKIWKIVDKYPLHSDLNDQNLFQSTIDMPPGVPGVSKNLDNQTEVHDFFSFFLNWSQISPVLI